MILQGNNFCKIFTLPEAQVVIQEIPNSSKIITEAKLFIFTKYKKHFFYTFIEAENTENYQDIFDTFNKDNAMEFLEFAKEEYAVLSTHIKGH